MGLCNYETMLCQQERRRVSTLRLLFYNKIFSVEIRAVRSVQRCMLNTFDKEVAVCSFPWTRLWRGCHASRVIGNNRSF